MSDHHSKACEGVPRRLADSGVGRVVACSCGNIHFDIEYLTLRFVPEAFKELADMLVSAQRAIEAQPAPAVAMPGGAAVH